LASALASSTASAVIAAAAISDSSAVVRACADGSAQPCGPSATAPEEPWLGRMLRAADPGLSRFLDDAKALCLQILVTVVESGAAIWASYEYRVDAEYFYPASAIKTLLAVAALRAMSKRAGGEIPLDTRILRCREHRPECEPPEVDEDDEDKTDPNGAPEPATPDATPKKKHRKLRVGEEITKLLSYSDNDSYNRLFDIVGHRELNEQMAELGYSSVRFHHRMDTPAERSRHTLRVLLMPPGRRAIDVPARTSDFEPAATPATELLVGKAYRDGQGLVEQPMSFARKNYVSLRELARVNRALLYPERAEGPSLGLSDKQRKLIVDAMTAHLDSPRAAAELYPLSPGVTDVLPAARVRYVGKSGRAYGFHLDNAYIEDRETGRALFVTVTVYANPSGVLNTDDYGYDEISRPLLRALGAALCRELLLKPQPSAAPP